MEAAIWKMLIEKKPVGTNFLSSSLVAKAGSSWRFKTLNCAQEQDARECQRLEEVTEECYGYLGQQALSAASHMAPPSDAHLHAIRNRKRGLTKEHLSVADNENDRDTDKNTGQDYLRDGSLLHPELIVLKIHDCLSWRKRKGKNMFTKNGDLTSAAVSNLNKFANDGNFMCEFNCQKIKDRGDSIGFYANDLGNVKSEAVS